jgi:hypothetical protein
MATKHTKITKVFGTALERSRFRASWPLCSLWLIVFVPFVAAQSQLPLEPIRDVGQGVTAAYEGWYRNADGTFSLLVGYFNRNRKEALDIPIGPNNRIEPGGPDLGQPTHFLTRRQWGVFTITVPADFGDKKIVWTLTANGRTTVDPDGPESRLRGGTVQGCGDGQHAAGVEACTKGAPRYRVRRAALQRRSRRP